MTDGNDANHSDESKRIFSEFLSRRESGEEYTPEELMALHPELEDELRALFDDLKAGGDRRSSVSGSGRQRSSDHRTVAMDVPGSSPESPAAPRVVGDFRIICEIGSGGMGTVYEAEQISLKRRVALKVLPAHLSISADAVLKFRREAEAGGRQSHPGVVAIYNVGEEGGVHFIAQELVEGGITLADNLAEIRQSRPRPAGYFREAAALMVDVADALGHAHQAGVIHRDIKPSNILITAEGCPKVTDFGLAKVEDALSLSRTGDFAGTPYYMSPEQAASRRIGIDKRTDIFSLGVTFYELLALDRPFEGDTSHEVLRKILLDEPRDPRKLCARVPRDLAVICLKAMEKKPEARYASMDEFSNDLRRWLSGDVILARPAGPGARLWKRMKRSPAISAAISVALLAMIALLAYILWSYPQIRAGKLDAEAAAVQARAAERDAVEQRDAKQAALGDLEKALERSDGLRLAALSGSLRASCPGLALSLALESARRSPGLAANNAVLEALKTSHELQVVVSYLPAHSLSFNHDATRLLVASEENKARIYDVEQGGELVAFVGHEGPINSAFFNSNETLVITASDDMTARIFDAATGEEMFRLEGHEGKVVAARFSPDDSRILTLSDDRSVRVWDAATGEQTGRLFGWFANKVDDALFSPDGLKILTRYADSKAVRLWDSTSAEAIFTFRERLSTITHVRFSPDGSEVLIALNNGKVLLVDASTGKETARLEGHKGGVNHVAFSPDGRLIVTASMDKTARVWERDVCTLEQIFTGHRERVSFAAFSPDSRKVLTFSDRDLCARLWDVETGAVEVVFAGHEAGIRHAVFSADGGRVATTSSDQTVRIWTVSKSALTRRVGTAEDRFGSVRFSPNGRWLVAVGKGGSRSILCDARTGEVVSVFPSRGEGESPAGRDSDDGAVIELTATKRDGAVVHAQTLAAKGVTSASFSPDSSRLFITFDNGRSARVVDLATGEVCADFEESFWIGGINYGAFSPDNRHLAIASHSRVARVIDATTGEELHALVGHKPVILNLFNYFKASYSPDGRQVLTSSSDGTARIWDAGSGKELLLIENVTGPIANSFFSPEGEIFVTVALFGLTTNAWDTTTGEELYSVFGFNAANPFSPDGRLIAAASPFSHPIQIRDAKTGEVRQSLWGHTDRVPTCLFSPDGKRLVTASQDGTARVWDLDEGAEILTIRASGAGMSSAAFSPDGRSVITVTSDGVVMFWPVDPLSVAAHSPPRQLTLMERRKYHVWSESDEKSLGLIDRLFRDLATTRELVAAIEEDENLTEPVRRLALSMAHSRLWKEEDIREKQERIGPEDLFPIK